MAREKSSWHCAVPQRRDDINGLRLRGGLLLEEIAALAQGMNSSRVFAHHKSFKFAPLLVIGNWLGAFITQACRRGVSSSTKESRRKHGFKKSDFQLRGVIQMAKTKIALAAVLFAATSSAAFAQQNYHPGSSGSQHHRRVGVQSAPVLQQRDVALPRADTSEHGGPFWYNGSGPTSGGM
jgi:hypothetical protein